MLEWAAIECPYCGQAFDCSVDCSAGDQAWIEDCPVCCRPIEISSQIDYQGRLTGVQIKREDD